MLTLWTVFDLFKVFQLIYSRNWTFKIYNTSILAQIKSNKVLSLCFGSGDTNYPQKLSKFTTFEALFDFHGYFMYIIMLQIFGNIVGNVSTIYRKRIKAEDLRLWGRPMWDSIIYWGCVQFTVKWARSHAFRSMISRSPTSTLAITVIRFLNWR